MNNTYKKLIATITLGAAVFGGNTYLNVINNSEILNSKIINDDIYIKSETIKEVEENNKFVTGKYRQINKIVGTTTEYWVDHINYPASDDINPARVEGYVEYYKTNGMIMAKSTNPQFSFDWKIDKPMASENVNITTIASTSNE